MWSKSPRTVTYRIQDQGIRLLWVGRDLKALSNPPPLSTTPGYFKPCPSWPGTLPGMGHIHKLSGQHFAGDWKNWILGGEQLHMTLLRWRWLICMQSRTACRRTHGHAGSCAANAECWSTSVKLLEQLESLKASSSRWQSEPALTDDPERAWSEKAGWSIQCHLYRAESDTY